MTDHLLQHFDLIASAPDGIKRLRELILELAVRGKLVPQDPNDEPASELLKRIQAEKARLVAEGKIRKDKTLPAIGEEEKPFELPVGWDWVRWNNIAMKIGDIGHKMPDTVKEGIPYVSPRDFYPDNKIDFDGAKRISVEDFERLSSKIRPEVGDIIYPRYGTIGENRLVDDPRQFLASYSCCVIKTLNEYIDPSYQFYFSISDFCCVQAKAAENKTTQANVGIRSIQEFWFPLPPLPEQQRIVAKVDELLALCDLLEAQKTEDHQAHASLVKTLLDTLTQPNPPPGSAAPRLERFFKPVRSGADADSAPQAPAGSAAGFTDPWPRLAAHFDTLFTTEASIDALKQTILQLAVMGRLVPQNPDDEPAGELLKQIQAEKARLVAEGTIKRDKTLPAIGEDEKPFELPVGWEWVRLFDCSIQITDGEHATPPRTPDRTQVPLVTAKNVRDGYMDYLDTDFVEQSVAEKCWRRCKPEVGDILMVSVGATLGRLSVIVTPQDMVIVRSVTLIRPCLVSVQYISLALKSPLVQAGIWDVIKQMAQPCIYLAQSSCLLIPLPPLPEQHRIVAKVDELMALCDQLASQLISAREVSGRYASAATSAALKAPCRPSNATLPPYSPLTSSIPQ